MVSRKLEERLEHLRSLRNEPEEDVIAPLRKAFEDRSNLIVAEAAKICAAQRLRPLIPELLAAFDRLFKDAVKTDSKCWGKTAIIKALTALDYAESPPFVRGMRHVQMEPIWGGNEDAAGKLRAHCVLALVQCTDIARAEILRHLVDGLTDSLDSVRIEAVRALEQMHGDEAELVLRLKAHVGDARPHLTGQVFDSLLALQPHRSVAFVAGFLNASDEIRDEAALALGASRLPASVQVLKQTWHERTDREFREVILRALSSSRDSAALEFLLELIRTGPARDAAAALEALRLHKDSPEIQQMIHAAQVSRETGSE